MSNCPYCGCRTYEGLCKFYLCKGDGGYRARIDHARTQELAGDLNCSYTEAWRIRNASTAKEMGEVKE